MIMIVWKMFHVGIVAKVICSWWRRSLHLLLMIMKGASPAVCLISSPWLSLSVRVDYWTVYKRRVRKRKVRLRVSWTLDRKMQPRQHRVGSAAHLLPTRGQQNLSSSKTCRASFTTVSDKWWNLRSVQILLPKTKGDPVFKASKTTLGPSDTHVMATFNSIYHTTTLSLHT